MVQEGRLYRFGVITIYILLLCNRKQVGLCESTSTDGSKQTDKMFQTYSDLWLEDTDTNQMNYGVAVADVDDDGDFEIIVAGFSGPNMVLKYNKDRNVVENIAQINTPYESVRDEMGHALGVCACDVDGDGREEIYVLNSNQAYAGISSYSDKLFKWRNGKYVDLFSDRVNENLTATYFAGRSVACLDRHGSGKYSIIVTTYAQNDIGSFALIEMNEYHHGNDIEAGKIVLHNMAKEAGIEKSTGGRSLIVGPITNSEGKLDIFFNNEGNKWLGNYGENFLFKNFGNGTFKDIAKEYEIQDENENGRGIALADFDHDGRLDLVVGNWEGKHRIFMQITDEDGNHKFVNKATPEFEEPCLVRTVIVADFDNDGHQEILFNNINDYQNQQPNRLFKVTSYGPGKDPGITKLNIGDAIEEDKYGTGGAVVDLDHDGQLELLLSHGEDAAQPLDIYKVVQGKSNKWIRFLVKTKYGAPARGASVRVLTATGARYAYVIDSGSGYLCQMEPVAHFGLGSDIASAFSVQWPDGKIVRETLRVEDMEMVHIIEHPDTELIQAANKATSGTDHTASHNHTEL